MMSTRLIYADSCRECWDEALCHGIGCCQRQGNKVSQHPMSQTKQQQLQFGQPVARATDPETSHLAAEDAKRTANTLRARCLETLKAHPEGLTDFQLADLVGAQQTSAGKRRGELVAAGLVEKTDEKRPAPSGSLALVGRYVQR